tara:strand:+ start:555 stop:737 length:183 start_codon:yes stop_codon:yes gene_type:complete
MTKKEYLVEILIDEQIELGTNIFAESEIKAMNKADELIREQIIEHENSTIDIININQINK